MEKTERLGIFMNSLAVGHLDRKKNGALLFKYEQTWLDRVPSMPISRQFPLQERSFEGKLVQDYFDNLLPDNRQVRERIAARARAGGTQAFDILSAIGRDCVGALQFYPDGNKPGPIGKVEGHPIREHEIAAILKNLKINPLGIDQDADFRISLAGAQSKTALLKVGNQWVRPHHTTPTTHILKPAIGQVPGGPDLSLSVENEWLCLRLLQAYNLNVATVEMGSFDGVKALIVRRFDRYWGKSKDRSQKKLFRLPQEDVCQALGYGPMKKYQSDGGPGIGEILTLLNESDDRDLDRLRFMKAQLIFWMLSAIDGHAKNFSLLIRPTGFILSPLYDVISAEPHVHPNSLPRQKIKLAMSVGNNRHYKISEIRPKHWQQTAVKYKFPDFESLLDKIIAMTPRVIQKISKELPPRFPARVSDPILKAVESRTKSLVEFADGLNRTF